MCAVSSPRANTPDIIWSGSTAKTEQQRAYPGRKKQVPRPSNPGKCKEPACQLYSHPVRQPASSSSRPAGRPAGQAARAQSSQAWILGSKWTRVCLVSSPRADAPDSIWNDSLAKTGRPPKSKNTSSSPKSLLDVRKLELRRETPHLHFRRQPEGHQPK